MKTTMGQAEGERRTMAKNGVPSQQKNRNGLRIRDNRPEAMVQQRFAGVMNSQASVQRQPEDEEELMQGKFAVQRAVGEEEELMQGKFAVQRAVGEEEDLLQGRFDHKSDPGRLRSS